MDDTTDDRVEIAFDSFFFAFREGVLLKLV